MKVADLLESRRQNWRELELMCVPLEKQKPSARPSSKSSSGIGAPFLVRFASLYRSACADLALADAYQLPQHTVDYLHHLVGRAHNQLYRTQKLNVASWWQQLIHDIPKRLVRDVYFWIAFCLFYGFFFGTMILCSYEPGFAQKIAGKDMIDSMDEMYSQPIQSRSSGGAGLSERMMMFGFYIRHNAGIGLRVFAFGILYGVGGLFETIHNACVLGAAFGYMSTTSNRANFFEFVTAHGPFELTAIVLAAAAGMRMGFSLIDTRGYTRLAALSRSTKEVVPNIMLAVLLFVLAASIEGFISPSPLPWVLKGVVAVVCTMGLVAYILGLGLSGR